MANLQVKDIDDSLYNSLKQRLKKISKARQTPRSSRPRTSRLEKSSDCNKQF